MIEVFTLRLASRSTNFQERKSSNNKAYSDQTEHNITKNDTRN